MGLQEREYARRVPASRQERAELEQLARASDTAASRAERVRKWLAQQQRKG